MHARARRKLRANRLAADIKLKDFALRCGVSAASLVCEWEKGTRTPAFPQAWAIERELGEPRVEDWGYDRATGFDATETARASAFRPTGTEG